MSTQLVVFALNDQEYGVDVSAVNGILRSKKFAIQSIPGTPEVVEGMINLRGHVSYIYNLRTKFRLDQKEISEESKFVMLNANESATDSNDALIGFIVDEVTDIVKLEDADLQPTPEFVCGVNSRFIKGVGKISDRLIIIISPEQILTDEEYTSIKELCN